MSWPLIKFTIISALCWVGNPGKAEVIQSLDGTWIAKQVEDGYELPATVPGGVYTDLMKQNIIDNIFFGFNDNKTKWVGHTNWTYALDFTVDEDVLNHEQVNLIFEGVDTFATIKLNDVTIGETRNMFVRYIFDVKNVLKVNDINSLKVFFANPVERGLNLNNEQLKKYIIPWVCPPDAYRGECHINMIRKMQASFSWDWGPSFPSMGLWKPVYLEAFNETAIRHIVTWTEEARDAEDYLIHIDTYFANNKRGMVNGTLIIKLLVDDGQDIRKDFLVNEKLDENGDIVKSVHLSVNKSYLELWWPNGYGEQPLYDIVVDFVSGEDSTSKTVKIGIRTVELVEEPLETGATFYFKINGVPIFMKGSNEIPINILPELGQDPVTIRYLLESARDVNMNMLRVWGGGVYESDYFYETADEMGIMIWQDFMFACSLYPATDEFLNNVIPELDHNIKRLYHHPSIVVYSGNNENEGVLADNWYGTQDNYDQYKKDYVSLYIDTIEKQFDRISRGHGIFVSSSPSNGNLTRSEGWVGQSPGNELWGDVHYYNYVLDPWDSNTYPIPRFCSEYGYQSLPFEDTWLTATNNKTDLNVSSDFMDWRQHHPVGNDQMASLIEANLAIPSQSHPKYSSAFIYLSEVYTSQAIKIETEHYRRYRSYSTDDGRGFTMGALYWQLNDVWVAPTWSSIDFTGRWKMLHYFSKDFFSNIIVTGHINPARELQIYTVNDQLSKVEDVTVIIRVYNYNSPDFTPVYETSLAHNLSASASQLIQIIQTDEFLANQKCNKNSCFFYFVIEKNTTSKSSVAISPPNYVFPGKLKDSSLAPATVSISSVKKIGQYTYEIIVTSDNVALFVWLDSHGVRGRFSENGFLQLQASKKVLFSSQSIMTAEGLQSSLTVTHLKDAKWA